jgi:cell wall-associated NlpC family hydrolase
MRLRLRLFLVVLIPLLVFPAAGHTAPPRSAARWITGAPPVVPRPGPPRVVKIALRYLGTPYRWAGASPSGFDCSGFVMYVYGRIGIALPHSSWMLWEKGRYVPRVRLQAGDVVFFNGRSHVGIYIDRGRFVHSPHTGDAVKISRLSEGSYRTTYAGARRYR